MPRSNLSEISYRIAAFANSEWPGFRRATLTIKLPTGEVVKLPVTASVLVAEQNRPTLDSPHGVMAEAIIEALSEIKPTDERPVGEALAELAGYPFNGRFREALARLVRSNHIQNHRPGYSLPGK